MSATNGIDSTATSMMSSPSIHGDRMGYNGQNMHSQMGYQNGYQPNSALARGPMGNPSAHSSYHQSYYQADRRGAGQDAFSVPLTDERDMGNGMGMGGQPQQFFSSPVNGGAYPTQNFGAPVQH